MKKKKKEIFEIGNDWNKLCPLIIIIFIVKWLKLSRKPLEKPLHFISLSPRPFYLL